jgi:nucleoid-associated protein YgaU
MGMFDFVKNAGAKIGIGTSTSEDKAKAAAAVAVTKAAEHAVAEKAAKQAEANVKAAHDATAKAEAERLSAEARQRATEARVASNNAAEEARNEAKKSTELEDYVTKMGIQVSNLDIRFDDGCAYIKGECATQADMEKLVLAVGNVGEVNRVIDIVTVAAQAEQSQIHNVVSGDTLSKIAKHYYGDANKYQAIFEANKPMLKDVDHIFPGQALRIPAL